MSLEINANGPLLVREECFELGGTARILYISDLHLVPHAKHLIQQLVQVACATKPEIILLGGDLVDRQTGLPLLFETITRLTSYCPVWAIAGNHDLYLGIEKVKTCVELAGGYWLEKENLQLANNLIQIDGECQTQHDPAIFSILCAHDPAIFPAAAQAGYKLVLAGHLHGSQCVLAHYGGRMYPGAWFFKWNGDKFTQNNCTLLVSRGVNDTLPIRWNCPREVILCKLS